MKTRMISLLAAFGLCILLAFSGMQYREHEGPVNVITWDVFGYYLYLPSAFIYHDPGLSNPKWLNAVRKEYNPTPNLYQVVPGKGGRQLNIYTMGLAASYAPGFLMAHGYAHLAGYSADGFSVPYQWAMLLSAFLYSCLGIFLLRYLLLRFFSDTLTAFLVCLTVLGTNFLFHAGLEGAMPHNFLFSLNCLLLLLTMKWHETYKLRYALLLAFFFGWAMLCRPSEGVWVLIPLFWNVKDWASLLAKCKLLVQYKKQVLLSALVIFLVLFPQLLYWKWTSGYWKQFNNHAEGFSFLSPYTLDFLFSYKKGWLLYTPLMLFALVGFYPLYKSKRPLFYPLALFIVANIYVLSSWDCWWYASSFSQRPMVESLPVMALVMGVFLQFLWTVRPVVRYLVLTCMALLITLNLFQTWQYCAGILDGERMTEAYYWNIFGKTDLSEADRDLLEPPGLPPGP
ncbi:MAG: hypothetical protein ACHQRM_02370 [Bacteroidia bacterium]